MQFMTSAKQEIKRNGSHTASLMGRDQFHLKCCWKASQSRTLLNGVHSIEIRREKWEVIEQTNFPKVEDLIWGCGKREGQTFY